VRRCTARNFGPIPKKFTDLERFKVRFPAIFRNFAAQTPHIRQGLSSEQFAPFERRQTDRSLTLQACDRSSARSEIAPLHRSFTNAQRRSSAC
jgi:hypothetical protein